MNYQGSNWHRPHHQNMHCFLKGRIFALWNPTMFPVRPIWFQDPILKIFSSNPDYGITRPQWISKWRYV